jgi:hypothetical protein
MRLAPLITRLTDSLRGQSFAEFALVLPILLLVTIGSVDLGRAYFTGITVENAAREGAFFGARKPACDIQKPGCQDPHTVQWHVIEELDGLEPEDVVVECMSDGAPVPLADCSDGDQYVVSVSTRFSLVTPIISSLVGSQLLISSSATSVVITNFQPIDQPPVAIPTAEPSDPPADTCQVPSFKNTKYKDAGHVWANVAGFTGALSIVGNPNPNHKVAWQSLLALSHHPCSVSITLADNAQPTPTPTPTPYPPGVTNPTPSPDASVSPNPDPVTDATPTPEDDIDDETSPRTPEQVVGGSTGTPSNPTLPDTALVGDSKGPISAPLMAIVVAASLLAIPAHLKVAVARRRR